MKQLRQSWPRRQALMNAPFVPLSDADFRRHVADRSAIPVRRGGSLLVAKWVDGPGMDADGFLAEVHAMGSTLEVRDCMGDVNIRVVKAERSEPASGAKPSRRGRSPTSG